LRQLMEWQRDLKDPTEFIETVKIDLFQDEVFVFTPKGDVKALPKGATPIDLAYSIHSAVGEHCSGARVNGLIVPLRYALRSGAEAPAAPVPEAPPAARRPVAKRSIAGVRVQGEADILVKFAKCCTPVPGDEIVGFISRGHGVAIHTRDCPKALDLDPARRVDVAWDDEAKTLRPVAVQVTCSDRPGLLAATSKLFTEHGVNT